MNKTKNIKNKNRKVIIFFIILTFLAISYFIFKNSNKPKFVDLYCKVKNNIQNIENANFKMVLYDKKENTFFVLRDTLGIEFIIDNDSINVSNNSLEIIKPFEKVKVYKIQIDPKLQKEFVNGYKDIIFFCKENKIIGIKNDTLIERNITITFMIDEVNENTIPNWQKDLDESNHIGFIVYDKTDKFKISYCEFGNFFKIEDYWYFYYGQNRADQ
jgi:hypothetical protein